MSPFQKKVIAYISSKKGIISILSCDGNDRGKVIAHVEMLVLKDCHFSADKKLAGGIIGYWDEVQDWDYGNYNTIFKKYKSQTNDKQFQCESIQYSENTGRYMRTDYHNAESSYDSYISAYDDQGDLPAIDNPAFIVLEIDDDRDHTPDGLKIRGFAFYKKRIPSESKEEFPWDKYHHGPESLPEPEVDEAVEDFDGCVVCGQNKEYCTCEK